MSVVPFIVPVLVIVSLPAPSVTLPVSVPLLLTVVLPDELALPVIVTPFVVVWKPSGSVVWQVTVVPGASGRQSASAGVAANTPKPARAVPSMRCRLELYRTVIVIYPSCSGTPEPASPLQGF